jgi:hypothetical protein
MFLRSLVLDITCRKKTFDLGEFLDQKKFIPLKIDFFRNMEVEAMVAHEESWTVMPEVCTNKPCNETCEVDEVCELCLKCMTNNQKHDLHLAYREAKNRGAMKRVFPAPKVSGRVFLRSEFLFFYFFFSKTSRTLQVSIWTL